MRDRLRTTPPTSRSRRLAAARARRRRIRVAAACAAVAVVSVVVVVVTWRVTGPGDDHRAAGSSATRSTAGSSGSGTSATSPSPVRVSASSRSSASSSTGASTAGVIRQQDLDDAVALARRRGMASSVAVVDTSTDTLLTAGDQQRQYPTASVSKTMIATRLLLDGAMHGRTAELARVMITRSDNDAADALYQRVGGDGLLPWIARHYGIENLGARPGNPGYWGSTLITAAGYARFYAAVRHDPAVWPWLSSAMHAHEDVSSGGEPNDFGVAAAAPDAAVKNGWNVDRDRKHPGACDINSTGFVGDDRYAVVILAQGPGSYYFVRGEQVVSAATRVLLRSVPR